MNQIELSKALGVSQSFISKFLRGERGCSLSLAEKLEDHFGQPAIWWMKSTPAQRRAAIEIGGNGNGKDRDG